jgi:phosphatidylserine/phosphatidylglycerophosphate/cardiolipin synthase-like enzyme
MHNKFIIVDSKTLELGSFNYTASAEKNNAENVLVVHGAKRVITDYSDQWEKLWNESDTLKADVPTTAR